MNAKVVIQCLQRITQVQRIHVIYSARRVLVTMAAEVRRIEAVFNNLAQALVASTPCVADVDGDLQEPRARRIGCAQAGSAAPRAHERLLRHIIGVRDTYERSRDARHYLGVRRDENRESLIMICPHFEYHWMC